jgi:hypothetical protein
MINLKKLKEPVYNVYKFKDGDALASKKSIRYFKKELEAKLVASNLSFDEACQLENTIRDINPDCFK